jgi:hypothetical protein
MKRLGAIGREAIVIGSGIGGARPMSVFEGFADDDAKFFRALARKNDRAWFVSHKAEFEQG